MPIKLPSVVTKEFQQSITHEDALYILQSGNKRFTSGVQMQRNLDDQRQNLTSEQHPIAVILGCIDSRVPSELIFDLGLGDVFNIRIAGNILNDDILGSLEFACNVVGAKLIIVLGHSDCGAIRAACKNIKVGYISNIVNKIEPIVDMARKHSTEENIIENVTLLNTQYVKSEITKRSKILKDMVESNQINIVSGVYNLSSGVVELN
jgi:carbonic anhydrase